MQPEASLPTWQLLALIGVILMTAEIFVPGFVVLPIGVAFLLTAIAAIFVSSGPALLAVLAVSLLGVFWALKEPIRRMHGSARARTNADGMIGAECEVTEAIPARGLGYVKLYGDRWQARTLDGGPADIGRRAIIRKIDGNKVVIELSGA